jgi:hypothetical protein
MRPQQFYELRRRVSARAGKGFQGFAAMTEAGNHDGLFNDPSSDFKELGVGNPAEVTSAARTEPMPLLSCSSCRNE